MFHVALKSEASPIDEEFDATAGMGQEKAAEYAVFEG